MSESKLKQFISKELNLPIECIYEEVQLITLCILSNYLKNLRDSEKHLLTINFSKLTINLNNHFKNEGNKLRIDIYSLFNKKMILKYFFMIITRKMDFLMLRWIPFYYFSKLKNLKEFQ